MAAVGGAISWRISRHGKRKALLISSSISLFGSFLLFIQSWYSLVIARVITGFAFGISNAVSPLFVYEIARAKYIEYFIVCFQVWQNIGFLSPLIFSFFLPMDKVPEFIDINY